MVSYFSYEDYWALASNRDTDLQPIYTKFLDLHKALYPRIRNYNLYLHPRWQKSSIISQESAACVTYSQSVVLTYFRSKDQAEMVERLMGKDQVMQTGAIDTYRHPVIELRLAPDHFAIELILSPYAWWDQQNLIGKLELPAHRSSLRTVLAEMDEDFCSGFWQGVQLGDMYLTTANLLRGRVLDEWLDTFGEGQDWLRMGKWYSPDELALDGQYILGEVFNRIKSLYSLYTFLLWTSNNNFRAFYEKRHHYTHRMYA